MVIPSPRRAERGGGKEEAWGGGVQEGKGVSSLGLHTQQALTRFLVGRGQAKQNGKKDIWRG